MCICMHYLSRYILWRSGFPNNDFILFPYSIHTYTAFVWRTCNVQKKRLSRVCTLLLSWANQSATQNLNRQPVEVSLLTLIARMTPYEEQKNNQIFTYMYIERTPTFCLNVYALLPVQCAFGQRVQIHHKLSGALLRWKVLATHLLKSPPARLRES